MKLSEKPMAEPVVAALQMVSGAELTENLQQAAELIAEAVGQGARLIVLPEMFAVFGGTKQLQFGLAEAFADAPIQRFLSEQARRHQVWLVGGSIPIAENKASLKVYAASLLYNDKGELLARYNKIHLFDVDVADSTGSYRESDNFEAGNDVVVVDTPLGRLGMAVCYDLRFPEFFRAMFAEGVDLISLPSAFTRKTGEAHWLPLIRARAIENQCYLIGANQGGLHAKQRETSGGSVIVDGWGRVLAEARLGNACITATIDRNALAELRSAMPIKQHQRFSVIKRL